ncbi:transporter substrate-binding domain-containing protein [Pseudoalteromonas sp. DL2-H2.2]|uniref:substrate-binding periplasmic protein n=1 Tax=Pseudoalteromonas sp. DL2-H2.2 TaxID=2908889 RepID=UPI001F44FE75|nr:ABC transporter substrate-binding protein [Pseudoalteromonas sp. DL2-H2.2]MCF2907099.1 transporter substrate-binding domain-containing protein [Pseudoalteromonas sp. DL2-H2.2]
MKSLIAAFMVLCASWYSYAETVYLTSLDWPPYSGKSLSEQGASVAVAKAAFAAEGHTLVVEFYPWSRAVKSASTKDSKYVGYFPEYHYDTSEFVFSDPMGTGPLGLVQNVSAPINYSSVGDLSGKRIGVVQDYVNTKELDEMIASGSIKGEAVPSDVLNIKKVAAKRIDAAVIDSNVLKYLLKSDASLSSVQSKVAMHPTLLQDKQLFVAFRNDAQGQKWQQIYNAGLKKIDIPAIMAKHLN